MTTQKKRQHSKLSASRGFSILELIVSVGLIATTLALFLDAIRLSLQSLDNGERKYAATKIAQEGMELFISKRNNNVLCLANPTTCGVTLSAPPSCDGASTASWQDGLCAPNSCSIGNNQSNDNKGFQVSSDDLETLLPGETFPLFKRNQYVCRDNFNRFVQCGPGAPSNIKGNPQRRLRTCVINQEKILVESYVEWRDRVGNTHTIVLDKVFFNTQP